MCSYAVRIYIALGLVVADDAQWVCVHAWKQSARQTEVNTVAYTNRTVTYACSNHSHSIGIPTKHIAQNNKTVQWFLYQNNIRLHVQIYSVRDIPITDLPTYSLSLYAMRLEIWYIICSHPLYIFFVHVWLVVSLWVCILCRVLRDMEKHWVHLCVCVCVQ